MRQADPNQFRKSRPLAGSSDNIPLVRWIVKDVLKCAHSTSTIFGHYSIQSTEQPLHAQKKTEENGFQLHVPCHRDQVNQTLMHTPASHRLLWLFASAVDCRVLERLSMTILSFGCSISANQLGRNTEKRGSIRAARYVLTSCTKYTARHACHGDLVCEARAAQSLRSRALGGLCFGPKLHSEPDLACLTFELVLGHAVDSLSQSK